MSKQRDKIYLDIVRVFAILLVVYNHTRGVFFLRDTGDITSWWLLLQNQVVKMAVPLFFMVTGALLLRKEENLTELIRVRVIRFLIVIILIAIVQYAFFCYRNAESFSILHVYMLVYQKLWQYNGFYAWWFLYAYVGILLMLPILRIIARNLTLNLFLYFIGLQFILCCVWPALGMLLGRYMEFSQFNNWLPFHPESDWLPYSAGYCAFYVLMGFYLEYKVTMDEWERNRGKYLIAAMACLFGGVVCMWLASTLAGKDFSFHSSIYLTSFLPVPCAVTYMTIKSFCMKHMFRRISRMVIAQLGGAVFTVMLIENLFRISWNSVYAFLETNVGLLGASWIYAVLICIASLVVGLLLKRIPGINRIV